MPCPPLVPISIIPPVSQGVAPILWRNGNQITRLNIPLNPSFLVYDGSKTRWGDGSAQAPIYLPNIQEVNSPVVTYVAGITSTGQLVKTLGSSGTAIIGGSAGSVVYQTAPSATGFTAVGTSGQLLSSNGASAPTWLNQSSIAAGSATTATTATTANTLTTARTISISGDVTGTATSFNGSANITIPVTINAGAVTPADLSTGGPYWDASGNVGIGTSAPIRKLHLASPSSVEQIWEQTDALTNYRKYNSVVQSGSVSVGATYLFRILNDAGSAATKNIYAITPDGIIDTQTNPINNCPTTAKAWVNFNGTLSGPITPASSYNVTSITKNGTGDYTVNFTTALSNANYSATLSYYIASGVTTGRVFSYSTTSIRILTTGVSSTLADANPISLQIFGN